MVFVGVKGGVQVCYQVSQEFLFFNVDGACFILGNLKMGNRLGNLGPDDCE